MLREEDGGQKNRTLESEFSREESKKVYLVYLKGVNTEGRFHL